MKFSIHRPKFKIDLAIILWIIFLSIVVVEGLVVYKYLYLDFRQNSAFVPDSRSPLQIDALSYEKAKAWLNARKDYQLPDYQLRQGGFGRENPFTEYR